MIFLNLSQQTRKSALKQVLTLPPPVLVWVSVKSLLLQSYAAKENQNLTFKPFNSLSAN